METEDYSSKEELSDLESDRHLPTPKFIVATEARKLMRMERLETLQTRKSQIVLDREIDKFKVQLEVNRSIHKMPITEYRRINNMKIAKKDVHRIKPNSKNCSPMEINLGDTIVREKTPSAQKNESKQIQSNEKSIANKTKPTVEQLTHEKEKINKRITPPKLNEEGCEEQSYRSRVKSKVIITTETKAVEINVANVSKHATKDAVKFLIKKIIRDMLSHYWTRWRLYVLSVKNKRDEEKKWREKINSFMKRANERGFVEAAKKEVKIMENKKGETAEKHQCRKIILLRPRIKTRDLTQNEYKALKNEISESNENTLKLTKEISTTLNPQLKCKAKLIRQFQLEPKKELHVGSPTVMFPESGIVQEMNRKHAERKQRMQALYEERRQTEEEKDRLAKEKYEQQLYEEKMEKKRRIQEFQKKLRVERQHEERKRQQWQRMKDLEDKATQHYRRHLLMKLGFQPWHQLVSERKEKAAKALEHNTSRIYRSAFRRWRQHIEEAENERMLSAEQHYTSTLMKTSLRSWKYLVTKRHTEMQGAEDWHDYLLTKNALQAWQMYTVIESIDRQEKWEQAMVHYRHKLLSKCVKYWMLFPQIIRLERAKEIRKKGWREKVQQVLPDFRPLAIYAE